MPLEGTITETAVNTPEKFSEGVPGWALQAVIAKLQQYKSLKPTSVNIHYGSLVFFYGHYYEAKGGLIDIFLSGELNKEQWKNLFTALGQINSLDSFSVYGQSINVIGKEKAEVLAQFLGCHSELTTLKLPCNNISPEIMKILAEVFMHAPKLKVLDLSFNKLGAEGVKILAEGLKKNTLLTELDLSDNNIGHKGAEALTDILAANDNIKKLILRMNDIGAKGIVAIAEVLKKSKIQELDLEHNNIGYEGAEALSKVLGSNKTLKSLGLSFNNIGVKGAQVLAEALKQNSTMEVLSLAYNEIGDEGATKIAEALKDNNTLREIYLNMNNIKDEGVKALITGVGSRQDFITLALGDLESGDISGFDVNLKSLLTNNYCISISGITVSESIDKLLHRNDVIDRLFNNNICGYLSYRELGLLTEAPESFISFLAKKLEILKNQGRLSKVNIEGIKKFLDRKRDNIEQDQSPLIPTIKKLQQLIEEELNQQSKERELRQELEKMLGNAHDVKSKEQGTVTPEYTPDSDNNNTEVNLIGNKISNEDLNY